jgi:flagellar basal-body rod protein FlgG
MNLKNMSNNLENSSTTGFQKRRIQFTDLLYQNEVMPGAASTQQTTVASGLQVGLGVRPGSAEIIQTQGEIQTTGNPLDLAIQGVGFFQIELPNGQLGYTRAGSFHLDAQSNIVTPDGNPLQPTITIPPNATNVSIGSDGTVTATIPGQTQASNLGIIQIATFPNPGGLNSIGGNIYLPTTASGDAIVGNPGGPDGLGTLQQNSLEQSNVSFVQQFVDMIVAHSS